MADDEAEAFVRAGRGAVSHELLDCCVAADQQGSTGRRGSS